MAKAQGIGGIFFKSQDPKSLAAWYKKHLGVADMFHWQRADGSGQKELTAWSIFPASTKYLKDSKSEFMINYIVDNLDETLAELRAAGVAVDENVEKHEYGNFGWITDPDGNRIELWQPVTPAAQKSDDNPDKPAS